ncbi:MAG: tetratricopeptide repeat protein [Saprospiraceae bacterium]|nr:tetratricopeptide repeat protein [Saprospiraceae bacterium]
MAKQNIKKVSQEEVLVDIAEVTKETQHWVEEYKKPIMYGAIALVVVIGGWFAWKSYVESNQKKAIQAIWKAEQMFERDSFALALNNPGGGYEGFLDVAKKYGSTPAGNLAHYYAGICYLNLGKFDEAIQQLDDFSPNGEVSPTMKYGALADAYSEKNDFSKALKYYKEAATSGGVEDMKAFYLKRYAMLSEKQGDVSTALDAYKEIKEKYGMTNDARDIDKYIARAESKKK